LRWYLDRLSLSFARAAPRSTNFFETVAEQICISRRPKIQKNTSSLLSPVNTLSQTVRHF
jgi:hypothetical protein